MSDKRELEKARQEINQLREENQKYRALLKEYGLLPTSERESILQARVRRFMSLFRGRSDVYALRFENESSSGYRPVRDTNGAYLPLTTQAVYDHLAGKQTVGLYVIQEDHTCRLLAFDFDKLGWEKDVQALCKVMQRHSISYLIERSRSGLGCHIWVFFSEKIAASRVRKLGELMLNEAAKSFKRKNLTSFDRMFPTQAELHHGGIGNLIALPLQGRKRREGKTVFLTEELIEVQDQWGQLERVFKYTRSEVDAMIKELEGQVPVAESQLVLRQGIHVPRRALSEEQMKVLMDECSFGNPDYFKAKVARRSTSKIPMSIKGYDEYEEHVVFPRGKIDEFKQIVPDKILVDKRYFGKRIEAPLLLDLFSLQEEATNALLRHETGTLSATTGFGKTVVGAALISRRSVNTLILVHLTSLMNQWKSSLLSCLQIDESMIGQIGGGKHKPTGIIDIAMVQSIRHRELEHQYGQVIVDECHHMAAFTFEEILKRFDAAYVHGLSATPKRKDGLHPLLFMQCGPIRYKITNKQLAEVRSFIHVMVPRKTLFRRKGGEEGKFQDLIPFVLKDKKRNEMIRDDVLKALDQKRSPLVLTDRIEHITILEKLLKGLAKNIIVLHGQLSQKEKNHRLQRLKEIDPAEERVILATGKYIGTGFDDPRLDTLFLVAPFSWSGTLEQYVGRLHRAYPDKESVEVYDYVDDRVPAFEKAYKKRLAGYKRLGYSIDGQDKPQTKQLNLFGEF